MDEIVRIKLEVKSAEGAVTCFVVRCNSDLIQSSTPCLHHVATNKPFQRGNSDSGSSYFDS